MWGLFMKHLNACCLKAWMKDIFRATNVALRPSIKPPDTKIRWPQVVVHHVEQHRDPTFVAGIYESLQSPHAPIRFFHRKEVSRVVAPGKAARKFVDRHQLHGIDAKLHQVVETCNCPVKCCLLYTSPSPRDLG